MLGHLVVHVLDPRARGRKQRDLVVDLIDAKQGRLADAVADARAERACPEDLVAACIFRAQPHVAEAGDAGIAPGKVTRAAVVRAHDQVDQVAGGVAKRHTGLDPAPLTSRGIAQLVCQTLATELGHGRVEFIVGAQLEAHRVIGRIALEVHQRVIPAVAAVVARTAVVAGQLEPHYATGKTVRCR